MSKRYQIFVSSTYADLKVERQRVIQALMEMDYIPAGMELFPSIDEEQWEFIKRVIDDSDYYILIIGGRYGSLTPDGISYTEQEFDYALEQGVKVIVFIHHAPDEIPSGKTDKDPMLGKKLEAFIKKVSTGRLVKYWSNSRELPGLVALSLSKTIKMFPAIGWVRANLPATGEFLHDMNELRKENTRLQKLLEGTKRNTGLFVGIADFDSIFRVEIIPRVKEELDEKQRKTPYDRYKIVSMTPVYKGVSWSSLFLFIALYVHLNFPSDASVRAKLQKELEREDGVNSDEVTYRLGSNVFDTIKLQFLAYGLIKMELHASENANAAGQLRWKLTPKGEGVMFEGGIVKEGKRSKKSAIIVK